MGMRGGEWRGRGRDACRTGQVEPVYKFLTLEEEQKEKPVLEGSSLMRGGGGHCEKRKRERKTKAEGGERGVEQLEKGHF